VVSSLAVDLLMKALRVELAMEEMVQPTAD
jgi:hypothetical protein